VATNPATRSKEKSTTWKGDVSPGRVVRSVGQESVVRDRRALFLPLSIGLRWTRGSFEKGGIREFCGSGGPSLHPNPHGDDGGAAARPRVTSTPVGNSSRIQTGARGDLRVTNRGSNLRHPRPRILEINKNTRRRESLRIRCNPAEVFGAN